MINTGNKYLMMIEPESQPNPTHDSLTELAESIWAECIPSENAYRGFHVCSCGERSDNKDWYTPKGRLTNSLLIHYVRDHRSDIPLLEIKKLADEVEYE